MLAMLCDLADSMGCKRLSELADIPSRELNLRLVNLAMKSDITWDQEKITAYKKEQERLEIEAFKKRAYAHFEKQG